jgi:ERCC4-type nuclease
VKIDVDVHEPEGMVVALRNVGFEITVRRIAVGDYALGRGTVVERKTLADLRASLHDGRLWRQLGQLRRCPIAYLAVEGPDVLAALADANAVRGALLSIADLGVIVFRTRDRADTAAWLALIAKRRAQQPIRHRSPHVDRPTTRAHSTPVRVLAGIEGVSETRAKALLTRFGTIASIAAASVTDLMTTPGVHAKVAKHIYESLHSRFCEAESRHMIRASSRLSV